MVFELKKTKLRGELERNKEVLDEIENPFKGKMKVEKRKRFGEGMYK